MTFGPIGHALRSSTFSPKDLFIGGTDGVWFDPSDLSTLFQTSTATTAVGAASDPVGYIIDKSGRGHDAVREVDDTHRALWTLTNDGRAYITFITSPYCSYDFSTNGGLTISQNANALTSIVGINFTAVNTGTSQQPYILCTPTQSQARFGALQVTGGTTFVHRCRRLDADGASDLGVSVAITAGVDYMILNEANYADRHGDNLLAISGSGASLGTTSNYAGTYPSTTAGATSNTASFNITLGTCGLGGTLPFQGRIYGLVIVNRVLTQGEKLQAIRWMGAKTLPGGGKFN